MLMDILEWPDSSGMDDHGREERAAMHSRAAAYHDNQATKLFGAPNDKENLQGQHDKAARANRDAAKALRTFDPNAGAASNRANKMSAEIHGIKEGDKVSPQGDNRVHDVMGVKGNQVITSPGKSAQIEVHHASNLTKLSGRR